MYYDDSGFIPIVYGLPCSNILLDFNMDSHII